MYSLKTKKYFPETQRAFADGELSLYLDRFGGVLETSLIDILQFNGRDYPDNVPLMIFSRRAGLISGRPLYGPAIQFLTEGSDSQVIYHYPAAPEVFPWGVCGKTPEQSFEMVLDNKRMLFRFSAKYSLRKFFKIAISRHHLYNGERRCCKNQRITDGCDKHCERAGLDFDPAKPFPNGKVKMTWNAPVFLKKENVLLWEANLDFPYGKEKLFLAASASSKLTLSETTSLWLLSADWEDSKEITTVFGFGKTREEAMERVKDRGTDFAAVLRRKKQVGTMLEKKSPSIDIEGMPIANLFMRVAPGYQNSLLLRDAAGIRAAQHKYGAFILWDTLYPIRDLLWNGQIKEAKELYLSMLGYPYLENSPWVISQMVLVLDEILSFERDSAFLKTSWSYMKQYLEVMLKLTNPTTGMIVSYMNTGVDIPSELGLTGLYAAPCINAWWYSALRILENLAVTRRDDETAKKVAPLITRLEDNYLKGFLSDKTGYLRSGINEDLSHAPVEAFQNTSTIGLDYPFGAFLMRNAIVSLAQYQKRKLYHPGGYTAVAWDTEIECEMWKSVHMNHHLGHEARLARMAGMLPEAYRIVECFLESFDLYKTAIETFNYSGCAGNETQTCDWQTFTATAVCEALRSGLAGIARHGGGLHYIPADDYRKICLNNLRFGKTIINIVISGKGKYFTAMKLNGKTLAGTAQLPVDQIDGKSLLWEIKRTNTPFKTPVLLNTSGLPVVNFETFKNGIGFSAGADGHFPIEVYSDKKTMVLLNGKEVSFQFDRKHKRVWMDLHFKRFDYVEIYFKKGKQT